MRVFQDAFVTANMGRDVAGYAAAMDRALLSKAELIFPHITVSEGGTILDLGSGTGLLAEFAAVCFSRAHVIAQDRSHELNDIAATERSLIDIIQADARSPALPPQSLDAAYCCSVMHEIETFGGPGSMLQVCSVVNDELKPGGALVIRDFVRPPEQTVYMKILGDDLENSGSADLYEHASVAKLFDLFTKEFQGGESFPYQHVVIHGRSYIELPLWAAYEFIMHEPYRKNWRNEVQETYGHWTLEQPKKDLVAAGYDSVEVLPEDNAFILNNRIKNRFALFTRSEENELVEQDFPHTHMVIVAHKSQKGKVVAQARGDLLSAVDYQKLQDSIQIDESAGEIRIDDKVFTLGTKQAIHGTKRAVYYLDGDASVIKIPRGDTTNTHNAYKSMLQAVERQEILDAHGVRRLEIFDIDSSGPPYRYFCQKALPEGSISVADLLRKGDLTEIEVKEICGWINSFELTRQYQLDTNPFNCFRVPTKDGGTELTYSDGKVYLYDPHWSFSKVGLLQWTLPEFIPEDLTSRCAVIPRTSFAENTENWWTPSANRMQALFQRYLDPELLPGSAQLT